MLAKDLSHFLSDEAKSREASPLKQAFKYLSIPGMISLGGGLPMPELFPFDDLRVRSLQPPAPGQMGTESSWDHKLEVEVFKKPSDEDDIPLARSLQYGQSGGDSLLQDFIREHISRIHHLPYEDWDIILNIGNSFAWDAVCRLFTNRGDTILVEQFSFPSALESARAQGLTLVPAKMDLQGLLPEDLDVQLTNWPSSVPRPKLLYTVPTGQNPVGSSLSAERREAIYKVAQKHDILIIEDEPYYYLQMPEYQRERKTMEPISVDELVKSFVPSFLNYDVDGRVVRLDSFSKVLAPGLRLGWVTCQKRFIERHLRLYETTQQAPSGISQSTVYGLLRRWGQDGYYRWLGGLRETYTHRRDIVCDTVFSEFPEGKYEFVPPVAGMFFWFKIDARLHRRWDELKDAAACENHMFEAALDQKLLIIPGHWFVPPGSDSPAAPAPSDDDKYAMYFRGTFVSVSPDKLVAALKAFAETMRVQLI